MSYNNLFICIISLICISLNIVYGQREYDYKAILDPDGIFELQWRVNKTHIHFEVTANTTGYIGFGISSDGQMVHADMVLGWISDGHVYFGDYYTTVNRVPELDASQDWILLEGREENGKTIIRFFRALDTCDIRDEVIGDDTMRVIYSHYPEDPDAITQMVQYHGLHNRGSKLIQFSRMPKAPENFPPNETFVIDFRNFMFEIPAVLHSRQCVVLNMTTIIPRSYMVKYEAIVVPGLEQYVYRMMLFRCHITDPSVVWRRYDCDTEAPSIVKVCKEVVATWARGGEPFYFPNGTGMSLGGPEDPAIYVLEIHYTNTNYLQGRPNVTDSSGIKVTYTLSPQQHPAGFLELGTIITPSWRQFIPHGEPDFVVRTFCSQRCLEWGFSETQSPMTAIGIKFHGNDIATSIKLRHFRLTGNSYRELPWMAWDKTFNSFYQQFRMFDTPIIVNKTDVLSLECVFNSSSRTAVTRGGWSQVEELCRATLAYYPRKPIDMCLSWSSLDELRSPDGTPIPEESAMSYLSNITDWDASHRRNLKLALHSSMEKTMCSHSSRDPSYAIDRFMKPLVSRLYSDLRPSCGP